MFIRDARAGIGVTLGSDYPYSDSYYRVRRYADNAFHLASHPDGTPLSGHLESDLIPQIDTWYRFKIQVNDMGIHTNIRARVWAEGDPEPNEWPMDAYDDRPHRPRKGRIGVELS